MRIEKAICRVVLLLIFWGGGIDLCGAQIAVFAAASLTDSLKEIAEAYEKQAGDKIVFNFGASSTLARQIEEGAPADIFFSADETQMNRLEGQHEIVKETRRDLLANSLVIIVAAKDGARVRSFRDLAAPEIKRIALGDPRVVPIGVYARKYLEQAGLWKAVETKVVPTENVRGALAAVEAGNADAAIVYKTDALVSKKVVIAYAVPPQEGPEIRYPVALLQVAKERGASEKFLRYMASEPAAKVFERRGFIVVTQSRRQ